MAFIATVSCPCFHLVKRTETKVKKAVQKAAVVAKNKAHSKVSVKAAKTSNATPIKQ